MKNNKGILWSGVVLVEQDDLQGLSQGDKIRLDIFHEEASKLGKLNFDWKPSTKARLWRFPKWSLKGKCPSSNLSSFVKESQVVKLSLPDDEVPSKFAFLVESFAKSGKESFCGYLKPEEDNLRPLCLMLTDKGLLGFCVDDPYKVDQKEGEGGRQVEDDGTNLYQIFDKTIKENFRIGCFVKRKTPKLKIVPKKTIPKEENIQGADQASGDLSATIKSAETGNFVIEETESDSMINHSTQEAIEKSVGVEVIETFVEADIDQYIHGNSDNTVNKDNTLSEAHGYEDNKEEGLTNLDEDHTIKDIEQDSTKKTVSAENKKDQNLGQSESSDASNEVILSESLKAIYQIKDTSNKMSHSTSFTSSVKEEVKALARHVLSKPPCVAISSRERKLEINALARNVLLKKPPVQAEQDHIPGIAVQASDNIKYVDFDPEEDHTYATAVISTNHMETENIESKQLTTKDKLSPSQHEGAVKLVMKPMKNMHKKDKMPTSVQAVNWEEEKQKQTKLDISLLQQPRPRVARFHVQKIASFDQARADRLKEYFTKKFSSQSGSCMKDIRKAFIQLINESMSVAQFVKQTRLTELSQVASATSYLQEEFTHLRGAVLVGTVKLWDLHWIFNDTSVDENFKVLDEVTKNKEEEKLVQSTIVTPTSIVLKYKGHGELKVQVGDITRDYLAIFTENHILFCNKSTRLTQELVQDFQLKNKLWNGRTEGKIYLPDMIIPTKQNEIHFFVVQDLVNFKDKFLNLDRLQVNSSLITRENLLKFSLALKQKPSGLCMSLNLIIPLNCELSSTFSGILEVINDQSEATLDSIDLFKDSASRLIDIPGIDEEIALKIVEIRSPKIKTLVHFIQTNSFGFDLMAEVIQWDVGLLARYELTVSYNGLKIDRWSVKHLEEVVFKPRFCDWKRPQEVPYGVMVAVLGLLVGKEVDQDRMDCMKSVEIDGEKSWVKFGRMAISVVENIRLFETYGEIKVNKEGQQKYVTKIRKVCLTSASKKMKKSAANMLLTSGVPDKSSATSVSTSNNNNIMKKISFSTIPTAKHQEHSRVTSSTPKQQEHSRVTTSTPTKNTTVPDLRTLTSQILNSSSKPGSFIDSKNITQTVTSSAASSSSRSIILPSNTTYFNLPRTPVKKFGLTLSNIQTVNSGYENVQTKAINPTISNQDTDQTREDNTAKIVDKEINSIDPNICEKLKNIGVDRKLFMQTYVKVDLMTRRELKPHLGNESSGYKVEDDNGNVNIQEAFDNFLTYAELESVPGESLLPSLEFQLLRLGESKDCSIHKYGCSLCKAEFVCHEDRHQHYLSDHADGGKVERKTVKRFECSLCKAGFDYWQGRHEHYVQVHTA